MSKTFDIIATVGPSSFKREEIEGLKKSGATILRVNGAHGSPEYIDQTVKRIKKYDLGLKIMIDLPGNKIRTANLDEPIRLKKGELFELEAFQVNHSGFFKHVSSGVQVSAYDSTYTFEIVKFDEDKLILKSFVDGELENNKGLHIDDIQDDMDFVFDKDKQLIKVALENEIDFIATSFVRTAQDIQEIKTLLGKSQAVLISKVETKKAVENIQEIIEEVDYILIDRGDLSSAVGLLEISYYEEKIVKEARQKSNLKIFLATQFLFNMVKSPVPSIAEVVSLHKAVSEGIDGIQLSEETAIGDYGPKCVEVIQSVYCKNLKN